MHRASHGDGAAKVTCVTCTRRHGCASPMAKLIDGRAVAEKVYANLRSDIAELEAKGVTPGLAVVLVGDNPASRTYVRSKDKMCRDLGLHSVKLELPASTTQSELLARVEELLAIEQVFLEQLRRAVHRANQRRATGSAEGRRELRSLLIADWPGKRPVARR